MIQNQNPRQPDTMIITSYLPTYRTPPAPVDCIDWYSCDLAAFGGSDSKNLVVDEHKSYKFANGYVFSHFLEAIAKRYIKQHPEMLIVEPEMLKKGFARSMLYRLAAAARNHGNTDMAIISGSVDSLNPPDELLDFEYIVCSLTINVEEMLRAVKRFPGLLEKHLKKRAKDRRYKYLAPKRLHRYQYWMHPENWAGFAGGFILDYYLYQCLSPGYRQTMWKLPQNCYTNDIGAISSVISIDQRLATVFEDYTLAEEVVRVYATVMGDCYGTYYLLSNPLHQALDALITEIVKNPMQYKTQLIERRAHEESAKRQSGPVLQEKPEDTGQWVQLQEGTGIEYPRVQLDRIVTGTPLEPADARQVPLQGADGSIIGTTRAPSVPVNEAREELERLLNELRGHGQH